MYVKFLKSQLKIIQAELWFLGVWYVFWLVFVGIICTAE